MINSINDNILNCTKCEIANLIYNDNSKSHLGCGKLLSRLGTISQDIMIVGLNPSKVRFAGLKHPFGADSSNIKYDSRPGVLFIKMLKKLEIYDRCIISNLVKCSTIDNFVDDIITSNCLEHLNKEIVYYKPKLIIACGNQVYNFLLNKVSVNLEKIYHPNYCFSYNGITIQEYFKQIIKILEKYNLLDMKEKNEIS